MFVEVVGVVEGEEALMVEVGGEGVLAAEVAGTSKMAVAGQTPAIGETWAYATCRH